MGNTEDMDATNHQIIADKESQFEKLMKMSDNLSDKS